MESSYFTAGLLIGSCLPDNNSLASALVIAWLTWAEAIRRENDGLRSRANMASMVDRRGRAEELNPVL